MIITALENLPQSPTQRIILQNISWQTYKTLLVELGDHRALRLAYVQGSLEITMPSDRHETYKQLLERMVNTLTEELNLRVKGFASVTLNREDLQRGSEPDSCYYIKNVDRIQGRRIDLSTDPPPDLVIEVDITSLSSSRLAIYTQLGIPEIWRCRGEMVEFYQLQNGEYISSEYSYNFPIVSIAIINQFLQLIEIEDDTTIIRAWREWVRSHLLR